MKLSKTISLVGFKTSGKTTLGRALAQCLECPFVETDHLIECHHHTLSCREIAQTFGQEYFRYLEREVMQALVYDSPFILALGGGSLMHTEQCMSLHASTQIIYLKTSPRILKERIWQQPTLPSYFDPLHPEHSFANIYRKYTALYDQWAHVTLDMDGLTQAEALERLISLC